MPRKCKGGTPSAKKMETTMLAGKIEGMGRIETARDDDPLCVHLWGYDPAEYFNYLTLPGKLSDNLASPSALACGVEATIAKIKGSASIR